MFGFSKRSPSERFSKKLERELSAIAVNELESDNKDAGVWGLAIVKAKGDSNKAISYYIELRVDSLKEEIIEENERIAYQAELDRAEKEKQEYFKRLRIESSRAFENYPAFVPKLYESKTSFSDTQDLTLHLLKMHTSANLIDLLRDAHITRDRDQYLFLGSAFKTYGEALEQYWYVISKAMRKFE